MDAPAGFSGGFMVEYERERERDIFREDEIRGVIMIYVIMCELM